jgi:hypothetical protein
MVHLVRECPAKSEKKWYNYHKSTTHSDSTCRSQKKSKDQAKQVSEKENASKDVHSFAFKVNDEATGTINQMGMLIDTGATSHIVTTDILKQIDILTFKPSKHFIELADGTRSSNIALKRGDAEVFLKDTNEKCVKTGLKNAVYIPSSPQDIFSVKAATSNGASFDLPKIRVS